MVLQWLELVWLITEWKLLGTAKETEDRKFTFQFFKVKLYITMNETDQLGNGYQKNSTIK